MSGSHQMLLMTAQDRPPRFDATLVAGTNGAENFGFVTGSYGSLSPLNYRGNNFIAIITVQGIEVQMFLDGIHPKNWIYNFSMSGPGIGFNVLAANAIYSTGNNQTQWRWTINQAMNPGNGYALALNL